MKRSRLLTAAVVISAIFSGGLVQAGPVEIVSVEPTPLFPRGESLMQVARLAVDNRSDQAVEIRAKVTLGDAPPHETPLGAVAAGQSTHEILVPDTRLAAKLRVELIGGQEGTVAKYESTWQPGRHWTCYLVRSAHTDLGYEGTWFHKQEAVARYIEDAKRIRDEVPTDADGGKYLWTVEHLFWLNEMLGVRPWSWYRGLAEEIKRGEAAVTGAVCGVHSHWQDTEELARSMYFARRHAKDRLGLDLSLYQIVDNPSVAWPVAQLWAQAGGRYVIDCRQGWRTGGNDYRYSDHQTPFVFWWTGPDRRHKVLFSYSLGYGYAWQPALKKSCDELRKRLIPRLEQLQSGEWGHYPYEMFLMYTYRDHLAPNRDEVEHVAEWNRRWRYPHLQYDDPAVFMAEMERRYADEIPTLSGDMNNYSADYAAINSDNFGKKRVGAIRLAAAQSLATIARVLEPAYDTADAAFEKDFWRLCEYAEHCWPTGPAPQNFMEANFRLFKTRNAKRVAQAADAQYARAVATVASKIAAGPGTVAVFNATARPRTDLVTVALPETKGPFVAKDRATGEILPVQPCGEKLAFVAKEVPGFGYATYELSRVDKSASTPADATTLRIQPGRMENRFYRVEFNADDGTIRSIFDKRFERELVDASAPNRFNQVIYQHVIAPHTRNTLGYFRVPTKATVSVEEKGPVMAVMRVETEEPASGAKITQRITLYRDLPRIEIVDQLHSVDKMWCDERTMGKQYGKIGTRYKDNMFVAFPLNVPDATIRADYSIGTVRPYDDQLRFGSHDYLSAHRFVDCTGKDFGVTWTCLEAPVVHLGQIRYNRFACDYKPEKPWLYSYAMSNRMAGLVWHHPDRCNADLHYSLTTHDGNWAATANRAGDDRFQPLSAVVIAEDQEGALPAAQSFIEFDQPNVRLLVFKPTAVPGRGFVLRVLETDGREKTDLHVRLPLLASDGVIRCNLVEDDEAALELDRDGRGFSLTLGPNDVQTVRLVPPGKAPAKVVAVRAESQSDKAIRLSWPAVEGAACYYVYRLPAPGEKAVLDSLAAQTEKTELLDDWLDLGTTYCYRVQAVSPGNLAGEPSDEVSAATSSENLSPPAPVRDLLAIERNWERAIVTWRTSRESDVAAYEIFRSQRPDFPTDDTHRIHTIDEPEKLTRQLWIDEKVESAKTYFYQVLAVDRKGRRSPQSSVSRVTLSDDPGPVQPETPEVLPQVIDGSFPSKALEREVPYAVWIPLGKPPADGWPVLLVLHSNGRNCRSLLEITGGGQGFVDAEFAVAFADGGTSGWIDSPVKPPSKYQSMLLELIEQLATKHGMGRRRDRRAVTGWSLGGYGALLLAARHPEVVGSVSSMIGLVDLPRTSPSGACSLQLFGPAESAPAELSITRQMAGLREMPIRLFHSAEGIDVPHHQALKAALDNAKVNHQFVSCPGAHDMGTALQMWPMVLAYHAEIFRKGPAQRKPR